jgi:hypothetical protein
LGLCGVCAIAGVVVHNPIATVDASSFARNDCRLSSPVILIVCPFARKAGVNCCPAECTIGRGPPAHYADSAELEPAPQQCGERRFAKQGAIGDGEASGLRETVRARDFGHAHCLVIRVEQDRACEIEAA